MQLREGLELNSVAALYIAKVYGSGRLIQNLKVPGETAELCGVLGSWKLVSLFMRTLVSELITSSLLGKHQRHRPQAGGGDGSCARELRA